MKREGRQHGLVQTYLVLPGESKRINKFESPPTAGFFTKVSQKPTNHSKFTGKTLFDRRYPANKAKKKTKGTQRSRSCNVVTNYRLANWGVVGTRPELKLSGFSASEILDQLSGDYIDHEDEIEDVDDDAYEESNNGLTDSDWIAESNSEIASRTVEIEEVDGGLYEDSATENKEEDDDDTMSFCDVGIVWKHVEEGDESWCLVEDLQD